MDMEELQHSGMLYSPNGDEFLARQEKCLGLLYDYNQTRPNEHDKRFALLKEMFAEVGEGCVVEPPLRANWGGHYVHFGKSVYANFNLTLVDDTHIYVGDYTLIAPNVTITTTGHAIWPELRENGACQFSMPVRIGRNCWIGAGTIIMPNVTIGDNTVIGAGSVVTKDIPANVVAMGSPCRVVREISERDKEFYYRDRKINWDMLR